MLETRQRAGTGVALIFVTALHTGFLGILLTLARQPLYPGQARVAAAWGAEPLIDQQLAGLIMWVPACAVYIVAGLALFAGWLRAAGERARRDEAGAIAEVRPS